MRNKKPKKDICERCGIRKATKTIDEEYDVDGQSIDTHERVCKKCLNQ
jgi:hypothetical protein